MNTPEENEVLTAESVKLLVKGDVLCVVDAPEDMPAGKLCVFTRHTFDDLLVVDDRGDGWAFLFSRFAFVSRPPKDDETSPEGSVPTERDDEPAGCAEQEVGRAVYERIEKLMAGAGPKPNTSEWTELDYLSHLANSVEEVGGYDGPEVSLSHPVAAEGEGAGLWRPIEGHDGSREPVLLIAPYRDGKTWSDIYHGWWQSPYTGEDGYDYAGSWARWPHPFPPSHFMSAMVPSGVAASTCGTKAEGRSLPNPPTTQERIAPDGWRKHDGGPCPVAKPDPVDLRWGFGIIERQPSDRVNWSFKWDWRPSAGTTLLDHREER